MAEGRYEFKVYAVGLVAASVCTSLADDRATAQLNLEHPTGVGPWQRSGDEEFHGGTPNPCPCNVWPDTHRHLLFEC
jgi:hypothetical protein